MIDLPDKLIYPLTDKFSYNYPLSVKLNFYSIADFLESINCKIGFDYGAYP